MNLERVPGGRVPVGPVGPFGRSGSHCILAAPTVEAWGADPEP